MRSKHGVVPGLAVIMVGERRDSAKYVSMKQVSNTPARSSHVVRCEVRCVHEVNSNELHLYESGYLYPRATSQ